MTPQLKPQLVKNTREYYEPLLSPKERQAYQAAHRLMTESTDHPELGTPGSRRSAKIDEIAKIILESM